MKGLFVTGTDTGVGKTFVSCMIIRALKRHGLRVGVMKPVETGCALKDGMLFAEDASWLIKASSSKLPLDTINPYRFSPPLAPSVAARLEGKAIEPEVILGCFEEVADSSDVVIVEGAGGLCVPLSDDTTILDIAVLIKLPLLIVAASKLGCINHTLATVKVAESASADIAGVIINHPTPHTDESDRYNTEEISRRKVPIIEELPFASEGELSDEVTEKLLERL